MASKLIHLLVALVSAATVAVAMEVNVTIYYESLCPDSLKFFKTQFGPALNSTTFKKYLKPSFVPWGKANITTDGSINCQHGTAECDGNRLQACALKKITEADVAAAYIVCLMSLNVTQNTTVYPVDACQVAAGKFYTDVKSCYDDTAVSTSFLKEYGVLTDAFTNHTVFGVPYIAFNNTKNDDLSNKATSDFNSTLCLNLKSENLKECPNSASTLTATLIPAALLFFLGRL